MRFISARFFRGHHREIAGAKEQSPNGGLLVPSFVFQNTSTNTTFLRKTTFVTTYLVPGTYEAQEISGTFWNAGLFVSLPCKIRTASDAMCQAANNIFFRDPGEPYFFCRIHRSSRNLGLIFQSQDIFCCLAEKIRVQIYSDTASHQHLTKKTQIFRFIVHTSITLG